MAFRDTSATRIYIGYLRAGAYARNAGANSTTDMHETTTFANTDGTPMKARAFIPGTNTSTFSIDGPLDVDGTQNGQADAVADMKAATTPTAITYMPLGTDGAAWLVESLANGLDLQTGVSQTSDWSLTAQTTGATDLNGVILSNDATVTTDTDGTSVDNGAGTTNGAVFHLHVTAFSGLTSDDIIVEGSTDNSFAGEETTIATFTQVSGLTSERVVVDGTVPRYLRVVDDVTGTGSITRLVAVSRR